MSLDNEVKLIDVVNSVYGLDSNFLPNGTVFTVAADGTGDFATINEALAYVHDNKWSNGTVTIQLSEGTFTMNRVVFDSFNCSIPTLIIRGKSKNTTIVNVNFKTSYWAFFEVTRKRHVEIYDITFNQIDGGKNTLYRGINILYGGYCFIQNVALNGFDCAIGSFGGEIYLSGSIEANNCNTAFVASNGGLISSAWNTLLTGNNCTNMFRAEYLGSLVIYGDSASKPVMNNVTTHKNIISGQLWYVGM